MVRLIDADALNYVRVRIAHDDGTIGGYNAVVPSSEIKNAPTVDAVPVVMCKDCIYWKEYCRVVDGVTSNHVCSRKREIDGLMHRAKADDFCSWAERKEE